MTLISIAIFLVSAAALGLELVLVRAFSIGHWHHLAYLVISTALLGFGAAGTIVSIGSKFIKKSYKKILCGCAVGFGLSVPVVFVISQIVPLDELQLIWDRRQIFYLFAYYLLFFVPFFFAGTFVALSFTVYAGRAGRLYFFNMTGSGLGVAGIVALMYFYSPEKMLVVISFTAFLAAILVGFSISRRWGLITCFCALAGLLAFAATPLLEIRISENKSFVFYSALPDAEILATRHSPIARLNVVSAATIRNFPGLSISYQGTLPKQMLIISDADGVTAINRFENLSELGCYDYMTSALPYHLVNRPSVCIIGAGGGSDVGQALVLGAGNVTAVEMNRQIIDLVTESFNDFSGGLYKRDDVDVIVAEGRNFLQRTESRFDIINISLLDSVSGSAAGLYALNESHLYTIEAINKAISRLSSNGLLSITRMLKTPPRDCIKMLATVTEALGERGVSNPSEHIIMIRNWASATIIVSPQPFSDSRIAATRDFATERSFDLIYLPGIKADEANRFHILEEPFYYQSTQEILSDRAEQFYDSYVYNIRPATDDRPYFFDFFKWKSLGYLIRSLGGQWLVFSEWGYLILAATLVQALIAAAVFIIVPIVITKSIKAVRSGKFATCVYFLLLGLAYMFLEMAFIQKMTLLIGHPVFGVAVILLGFLVFSGCGALFCDKRGGSVIWRIRIAVLLIVFVGLIVISVLTICFDWLVGFDRPIRIALALAIIAPLAFFMGMPFPTGLQQVNEKRSALVPWAWAVNGFASVTAAVLGTLLAISIGFTALTLIAFGCYLLAAIVSKPMCR